jgi:hypothetical protein
LRSDAELRAGAPGCNEMLLNRRGAQFGATRDRIAKKMPDNVPGLVWRI